MYIIIIQKFLSLLYLSSSLQNCHFIPFGSKEIINIGFAIIICRTRVTLKKDGVVIDLVPPPTKVNNLIFGRTWIDSPGEMVMTNLTTGDKVILYFQPCGWFGYVISYYCIVFQLKCLWTLKVDLVLV